MSPEHARQRPLRRYLTKRDLAARYGWKSTMSVDRAVKVYGTLPPPTTYQGRHPLWAAHVLDEHDDRSQVSNFAPEIRASSKRNIQRALHTLRKKRGRAAKAHK